MGKVLKHGPETRTVEEEQWMDRRHRGREKKQKQGRRRKDI